MTAGGRDEHPYPCGAFISGTGELCVLNSDHDGPHLFKSTAVAQIIRAIEEFGDGDLIRGLREIQGALSALRGETP